MNSFLDFAFHYQLTGLFQFTVRLASETEARFTSVERINHYIKVRMRKPFTVILILCGVLLPFCCLRWSCKEDACFLTGEDQQSLQPVCNGEEIILRLSKCFYELCLRM